MKTGPVLVWELLDDPVSYYEQDAGKKLAEFLKEQGMIDDPKLREELARSIENSRTRLKDLIKAAQAVVDAADTVIPNDPDLEDTIKRLAQALAKFLKGQA